MGKDKTQLQLDITELNTILSTANSLPSYHKVTIDGVENNNELNLISKFADLRESQPPYNFSYGVLYNNEIHILGGSSSGDTTKHYKWDGSSWTEVSTLPYGFYDGCCVVYNNEIHILGGYNDTYYKNHYKYDGSSWTSVSRLPFTCKYATSCVYNNELHTFGGTSTSKEHYKYDGSSWTQLDDMPTTFSTNTHVVSYNDKIYTIIYNGGRKTYTWDSINRWSIVINNAPDDVYAGFIVFNNELHLFSGDSSKLNGDKHYKLNETSWIELNKLPLQFSGGCSVVYNNHIHILQKNYHYSLDNKVYIEN